MIRRLRTAWVIFFVFLFGGAACAALPSLPRAEDTSPTKTPLPVSLPATSTPSPTPTLEGPRVLRVWLPPRFDPSADTPAGRLLQSRLREFELRRPGLKVEVRIKAETGDASLLASLLAAADAAPSALPDLVALPRSDAESAARQGVLHPLDGLTDFSENPDWYPYAREMARFRNAVYGIPFAADALALLYHPLEGLSPTWESFQENQIRLLFAADDPRASFALCLYLSAGGTLTDDSGAPALDSSLLTQIFSFYQSDAVSSTSVHYQEDDAVLRDFLVQPDTAAVLWVDSLLDDFPKESALAAIPSLKGESCSLASGWIWSLAGSNPDLQPVAVELAEFLTDSEFLSAWSDAAGVLPPRPNALAAWTERDSLDALQAISAAARPLPEEDILSQLTPSLHDSILQVLNREISPEDAAQGGD